MSGFAPDPSQWAAPAGAHIPMPEVEPKPGRSAKQRARRDRGMREAMAVAHEAIKQRDEAIAERDEAREQVAQYVAFGIATWGAAELIHQRDEARAEVARFHSAMKGFIAGCCEGPRGSGVGVDWCESYGCSTLMRLIDPAWVAPPESPSCGEPDHIVPVHDMIESGAVGEVAADG